MRRFIPPFLFLIFITLASANIIFVSPLGSDLNNGSDISPVFSYSRAFSMINLLEPSTINFEKGVYRNMNIELINLGNFPLTLQATNSNEKPIFYKHDIQTRNSASGDFNTIVIQGSSDITIQGISFQVDYRNLIIGLGSHIYINASRNIVIQDCEILGNRASIGTGLFVSDSENVVMSGTLIADNKSMRRDITLENLFSTAIGSFFNVTDVSMSGNIPFFVAEKSTLTVGIAGGLFVTNSSIDITACIFRNNSATYGGAIFLNTDVVWKSSSSLFDSNSAINHGSVMYSADVTPGKVVSLPNCVFVNNMCRVWSCKMIYSELWQNQYNQKLADYAPGFVLAVDIIILVLVVAIFISGLAQCGVLYVRRGIEISMELKKKIATVGSNVQTPFGIPFLKVPQQKSDRHELMSPVARVEDPKNEDFKTDGVQGIPEKTDSVEKAPEEAEEVKDEPKTEVQPVESNPSDPVIVSETKNVNADTEGVAVFDPNVLKQDGDDDDSSEDSSVKPGFVDKAKVVYAKVTDAIYVKVFEPLLSNGLASLILQSLFSLFGITYPKQIPKVWGIIHTIVVGLVLILTALKAFSTSFGVPTFVYDVFDLINLGFGSAEYILVYGMSVTAYFSIVIGSNIMHSVIFRDRDSKNVFFIVLFTFVLLVIGVAIAIIGSILSLDLPQTNPNYSVSEVVFVIYWVMTALVICFLIVLTVLLVSYMTQRIHEFFDTLEESINNGTFSYEETLLNYTSLKQFLATVTMKTSYYLGPILAHLAATVILEIIMDVWGISGFYSGKVQGVKYAVIVCFGLLALFLFIAFAWVSQVSLMTKARLLRIMMQYGHETKMITYENKIKAPKKMKKVKISLDVAKKTIYDLQAFSEFLSSNIFEYRLFGIVALQIAGIISYATLFISLFAIARTLLGGLSSTLYSY